MIPLGTSFFQNYNPPRDGTCQTPIVAGTMVGVGCLSLDRLSVKVLISAFSKHQLNDGFGVTRLVTVQIRWL